jgi:uncharacterized protein YjbI with pentapeptide repeats
MRAPRRFTWPMASVVIGVASLLVVGPLVGSSAAAIPAKSKIKAPGKPTALQATPISGGANASWSPPKSNGGSPIESYTASAGTSTCSTKGTSCSITGLTNGKKYVLKVAAVNAIGQGKAASTSFIAGQGNCSKFGPGANLDYCNLYQQGVDLSGFDLAGASLTGTNLRNIPMIGTNLSNATIVNSDLEYATLTDANLTGAVLSEDDSTFLDYVTSGGIVGTGDGQIIAGEDDQNTDMIWNGYIIGPYTNDRGANLSYADFTEIFWYIATDFTGANLTGANFSKTALLGDTFDSANLTDADLAGAITEDSNSVTETIWSNTTCPDDTNSNNDGGTCVNNQGSGFAGGRGSSGGRVGE